jgi:hypothetical protein
MIKSDEQKTCKLLAHKHIASFSISLEYYLMGGHLPLDFAVERRGKPEIIQCLNTVKILLTVSFNEMNEKYM